LVQRPLPNRKGVATYANGERYEGDFRDGEEHGHGTLKLPNGAIYEGDFYRGKPEGMGTLKDADGKNMTGAWHDGCWERRHDMACRPHQSRSMRLQVIAPSWPATREEFFRPLTTGLGFHDGGDIALFAMATKSSSASSPLTALAKASRHSSLTGLAILLLMIRQPLCTLV
jgi:hypothetical protein